jgi:fucose permease
MPTPIFLLLLVLFVGAAGIIVINLTGDPGIDYWDLDGDSKPSSSRLDALRTKPVFYSAGAVLIGAFIAYLMLRH